MSDDLGRGVVNWTADRWLALDTIAVDATTASVVMRNLLEHREQPDAHTARIAGADVPVAPIVVNFTYDMQNLDAADLERGVRLAAQQLAVAEDQAVINAMNLQNPQQSANLLSPEFIRAKNTLRGQGVQQGFGVVVSTNALTDLESEAVGVRSGLELVERVVGTTVAQSNGLPAAGNIHAVLLQASPAAFQIVHAYGPRIRVMGVRGGNLVDLQLEEGIAVGQLTPNRSLGIQLHARQAQPGQQAQGQQAQRQREQH